MDKRRAMDGIRVNPHQRKIKNEVNIKTPKKIKEKINMPISGQKETITKNADEFVADNVKKIRQLENRKIKKKFIEKSKSEYFQKSVSKLVKPSINIFEGFDEQKIVEKEGILNITKTVKPRKKISKFQKRLLKVILFIIFFIILFSFFDKTTIHIKPNFINKSIQKDVLANLYPESGELGFDIISITESEELLITPQTEEIVEEKASGTIRIFNNYSTEPQRLAEETRFQAVGGKIFKTAVGELVIVPGKNNGNPGSVDVVVYAEKTGSEYNIDLTDFSLPGFKEDGLDSKYAGIYGLSVEKMTGGFIGTKKVLSNDQEIHAIQELKNILQEKLEQRMNAEKTNQFFLIENGSLLVFEDIEKKAEGENIRLSQKARGSSIIIAKNNLESFILNNFFDDDTDENIEINSYSNTVIKNTSVLDFNNLQEIKLHISSDIVYRYVLDVLEIKNLFINKEKEKLFNDIDQEHWSYFDIQIFPFWKNTTSGTLDKFDVTVLQ